jgi:energy-converting hydrogenase Eha subunit A
MVAIATTTHAAAPLSLEHLPLDKKARRSWGNAAGIVSEVVAIELAQGLGANQQKRAQSKN